MKWENDCVCKKCGLFGWFIRTSDRYAVAFTCIITNKKRPF